MSGEPVPSGYVAALDPGGELDHPELCYTHVERSQSYPITAEVPPPVRELAGLLDAPRKVEELAARIYWVLKSDSRGGFLLAAVALILAGRQLHYLITTGEAAAALRRLGLSVSKRKIAVRVANHGKSLGVWRIPPLSEYVSSVIRSMGRSRDVEKRMKESFPERRFWSVLERIRMRALRLSRNEGLRRLSPGKSPLVTAAAVVYIAALTLGMRNPSQALIARAVGVNESVLRRRVSELLSLGVGMD